MQLLRTLYRTWSCNWLSGIIHSAVLYFDVRRVFLRIYVCSVPKRSRLCIPVATGYTRKEFAGFFPHSSHTASTVTCRRYCSYQTQRRIVTMKASLITVTHYMHDITNLPLVWWCQECHLNGKAVVCLGKNSIVHTVKAQQKHFGRINYRVFLTNCRTHRHPFSTLWSRMAPWECHTL